MVTLRGAASRGPAETQEQNLRDGPRERRWDQRLPVPHSLHTRVKGTCRCSIHARQPLPQGSAALAVVSFHTHTHTRVGTQEQKARSC